MQTTSQTGGLVAAATAIAAAGSTVVLRRTAKVRQRMEVKTGRASTIGAAHHAVAAAPRTSILTSSGACRAAGGSQAATARAVPSKRSVMREVRRPMSRAARLWAGRGPDWTGPVVIWSPRGCGCGAAAQG